MITFSVFLSFCVYLSFPSLSHHAVVVLHTEVNLMWAGHQTHHSSEDYNLVTALRQSAVHRYVGWVRERVCPRRARVTSLVLPLHRTRASICCFPQAFTYSIPVHFKRRWKSLNAQSYDIIVKIISRG